MYGSLSHTIATISVLALPIIIAITIHEASHGFVAWRCGDDTAYRMGRVTFNPLKHVDPFGTIVLPLLLLLAHTGFLFGYAKPVPINPLRFHNYRRDLVFVAAAGPGSNLVLSTDAAATLVEDCAALAAQAGAELDRRARDAAAEPLPGQDSLL